MKATLLGCEQGTRVRSQHPHTKAAFIYEHLPMAKLTYTDADVRLGTKSDVKREGQTVVHTHRVLFARPLTRAEQHLFADVLVGFYYTVHFSQQFGNGLIAEPVVEFLSEHEARYTLKQRTLSGSWKDLLFAVLANCSHECAPIQCHDWSRAFDPAVRPRRTADDPGTRAT